MYLNWCALYYIATEFEFCVCVCCKCFFFLIKRMFTWCWNAQHLQKKHSENDKRPVQHINRAIFTFYIYREWKMHQYLNAAKLGQHINFWVHNFKQQLGKKRRYTLLFFPIISWKINILMKLTISNETKPNSECFDWWFRARSPRKQLHIWVKWSIFIGSQIRWPNIMSWFLTNETTIFGNFHSLHEQNIS